MGILFGLIAAVCWGSGDFLISQLTRRAGTARAMVLIQSLSLLGWIVLLIAQPQMVSGGARIWTFALIAGVCHVLGLTLTYRAFEIGTLSLVSPIASSFAVITAVLALATGSEKPPFLALSGSLLLIAGVVLATRVQGGSGKRTLAGVPEAIGSALAFGTMFWLFDTSVTPNLGYIWPLILLKTMATGSALFSLAASRAPAQVAVSSGGTISLGESTPVSTGTSSSVAQWTLALGVAVTDILAWLAWLWGIRTEYATIVTAVASLFSVVTILMAWGLMHERLTSNQWRGVAIILLGILLVSI
jgi:drug/metabolite transporter (DMT)-like permease